MNSYDLEIERLQNEIERLKREKQLDMHEQADELVISQRSGLDLETERMYYQQEQVSQHNLYMIYEWNGKNADIPKSQTWMVFDWIMHCGAWPMDEYGTGSEMAYYIQDEERHMYRFWCAWFRLNRNDDDDEEDTPLRPTGWLMVEGDDGKIYQIKSLELYADQIGRTVDMVRITYGKGKEIVFQMDYNYWTVKTNRVERVYRVEKIVVIELDKIMPIELRREGKDNEYMYKIRDVRGREDLTPLIERPWATIDGKPYDPYFHDREISALRFEDLVNVH